MANEVKEFHLEIKPETVRHALWWTVYLTGLGVGYYLGKTVTKAQINDGMTKAFLVNPELKPMMDEACKKVSDITNG